MSILIEDERDAKRQITIQQELLQIIQIEMDRAAAANDGAAGWNELLPARKALLDESAAIVKRQVDRLVFVQ